MNAPVLPTNYKRSFVYNLTPSLDTFAINVYLSDNANSLTVNIILAGKMLDDNVPLNHSDAPLPFTFKTYYSTVSFKFVISDCTNNAALDKLAQIIDFVYSAVPVNLKGYSSFKKTVLDNVFTDIDEVSLYYIEGNQVKLKIH